MFSGMICTLSMCSHGGEHHQEHLAFNLNTSFSASMTTNTTNTTNTTRTTQHTTTYNTNQTTSKTSNSSNTTSITGTFNTKMHNHISVRHGTLSKIVNQSTSNHFQLSQASTFPTTKHSTNAQQLPTTELQQSTTSTLPTTNISNKSP
jgi:hypothetical protein